MSPRRRQPENQPQSEVQTFLDELLGMWAVDRAELTDAAESERRSGRAVREGLRSAQGEVISVLGGRAIAARFSGIGRAEYLNKSQILDVPTENYVIGNTELTPANSPFPGTFILWLIPRQEGPVIAYGADIASLDITAAE